MFFSSMATFFDQEGAAIWALYYVKYWKEILVRHVLGAKRKVAIFPPVPLLWYILEFDNKA